MTGTTSGVIMEIWTTNDAKAKLSEVMRHAKNNPLCITHKGKETCIMMSVDKYEELSGKKPDFVSFINASPIKNINITFDRDGSSVRPNIEFE